MIDKFKEGWAPRFGGHTICQPCGDAMLVYDAGYKAMCTNKKCPNYQMKFKVVQHEST